LVRELTTPIARSWWTVVAGSSLGLAAAWLTLGFLEQAGRPAPAALPTSLLGIAIGLIVIAGPPLVRSAVNPHIGTEEALRDLADLPSLGVIPRIRTVETTGEARRRLVVNLVLSFLALALLAAAVLFGPGNPA
jgi:hypothetical protein